MNARPPILLVIGPSGSGKSSAVRRLVAARRIRLHPTWTTRPKRSDEATGSPEHRFVDDARFDVLRDRGFFLDTVELFGLPHRYGLPPIAPSGDGLVDTVMLRAPLVRRFRDVVGDLDDVVVQIEDAPSRLAERLRRRGSPPEELAARLADNRREIEAGRAVADVVLRNDGTLDALTERLDAVVRRIAGASLRARVGA